MYPPDDPTRPCRPGPSDDNDDDDVNGDGIASASGDEGPAFIPLDSPFVTQLPPIGCPIFIIISFSFIDDASCAASSALIFLIKSGTKQFRRSVLAQQIVLFLYLSIYIIVLMVI